MPGQQQIQDYLAGLAAGSRRTIRQSLQVIASTLVNSPFQKSANNLTVQESNKPSSYPSSTSISTTTSPTAAPGDPAGWDWSQLSGPQVLLLRQQLAERYAPATVNKMLAALRGLMRTYRRAGLISETQYQAIAQVGPVNDYLRKASRTLRDDELAALTQSCLADPSAAGLRDGALLAIMLTGGLRSQEVIDLDLADLKLSQARYHVRSNIAPRDRWIALGKSHVEDLKAWVQVRGSGEGPLLCPVDKGGTIRLRRLTSTALLGILTRRAQAANLEPVSTRDLRRSLIVRLIAAGLDLEQVRQRVGHLSWLTTGAYRDLAQDLLTLGPVQIDLPGLTSSHPERSGT